MDKRAVSKLGKIKQVIDDWLDQKRRDWAQFCEDEDIKLSDPFADVQVKLDSDHVRVEYDGAGYDYLSQNAAVENPFIGRTFYPGVENQEKLNKRIQEIEPELYIENINSWSFGIWI